MESRGLEAQLPTPHLKLSGEPHQAVPLLLKCFNCGHFLALSFSAEQL